MDIGLTWVWNYSIVVGCGNTSYGLIVEIHHADWLWKYSLYGCKPCIIILMSHMHYLKHPEFLALEIS